MPNIRVLATDLEFPEGPVVMPDGSVVLVEIRGRRLTRVWPDGRKEIVAQIPGGPNGAALGPDGKMYVCNNGGFSWIPSRGTMMPGAPEPHEYIGGSIQRVDLFGEHRDVGLETRGWHSRDNGPGGAGQIGECGAAGSSPSVHSALSINLRIDMSGCSHGRPGPGGGRWHDWRSRSRAATTTAPAPWRTAGSRSRGPP